MRRTRNISSGLVCTFVLVACIAGNSLAQEYPAATMKLKELKAKGVNNLVRPVALINIGKKKPFLLLIDRLANGKQALVRMSLKANGRAKQYTVLHETENTFQGVDVAQIGKKVFAGFVTTTGNGTSPSNDLGTAMTYVQDVRAKGSKPVLIGENNPSHPLTYAGVQISPVQNQLGVFLYDTVDEPGGLFNEAFFQKVRQNGDKTGHPEFVSLPNFSGNIQAHVTDLEPAGPNRLFGTGSLENLDLGNSDVFTFNIDASGPTPTSIFSLIDLRTPPEKVQSTGIIPDDFGTFEVDSFFDVFYDITFTGNTIKPRESNVTQVKANTFEIGNKSLLDIDFETPPLIFTDGFESGDVSAWSSTVGNVNSNSSGPAASHLATYIHNKYLKKKDGSFEQWYSVHTFDRTTGSASIVASLKKKFDLTKPFEPLHVIMKGNALWIIWSGTNEKTGKSQMFISVL